MANTERWRKTTKQKTKQTVEKEKSRLVSDQSQQLEKMEKSAHQKPKKQIPNSVNQCKHKKL